MTDKSSPCPIVQDEVYPIGVLSAMTGCTERRLREEISSKRLRAATVTRTCVLIPGWSVMRWVSMYCHEADEQLAD